MTINSIYSAIDRPLTLHPRPTSQDTQSDGPKENGKPGSLCIQPHRHEPLRSAPTHIPSSGHQSADEGGGKGPDDQWIPVSVDSFRPAQTDTPFGLLGEEVGTVVAVHAVLRANDGSGQ